MKKCEEIALNVDALVETYFKNNVKQVFVYITSRCQLRCKQCLYKPLLKNNSLDLDYYVLIDLLKLYRKWGAYKLSFLGGEPTLYRDFYNDKTLSDVVASAKEMGYEYIRIDTNGQFDSTFLENEGVKMLDEITFSLDGHNQETNDSVRGFGSFQKCVYNIKKAVELGYNVQITSCVHKYSCPDSEKGLENLISMVAFAQKLGAKSINFHPILKVGIDRDSWIDSTNIEISDWKQIYNQMISAFPVYNQKINIRIPMRFVDKDLVENNIEKYHYCPLEMGERALIMPDGQIKVCAFTIGTDKCVARFNKDGICYEGINNELQMIGKLDKSRLCYNQKGRFDGNIALCMSYKPYQEEIVWKDIKNEMLYSGKRYNNGDSVKSTD